MIGSHTRIELASGSGYLQQLCKHWSPKFEAEFTQEKGRIPFGDGRVCLLEADDAGVNIAVEAGDEEALARTERVVFEHLKRFAFRDELAEPVWLRTL